VKKGMVKKFQSITFQKIGKEGGKKKRKKKTGGFTTVSNKGKVNSEYWKKNS